MKLKMNRFYSRNNFLKPYNAGFKRIYLFIIPVVVREFIPSNIGEILLWYLETATVFSAPALSVVSFGFFVFNGISTFVS